ncbi:uncharacterized protein LOC111440990 [Cucurbita moschata]|uniref:Uncharacterized protein LOC111440990 n=1 Tax=Cucurbita moschata TaxID=3662 RepID=A0A6J1F089_CUCMO|nr:uncharacterized protein LOC111440990 [Cucurbita moschata]XP_022933615.1 uncharacterized protein LOC111440990 [Cucurbita moschata]XP_022933616.1 uncharacterized protein LOC111440990 [Cucurbita moschata]XP_022933617.1 uncharacterized protein LOC111440990 [Cucurbita moschata]XP_022933619.1 uncharacterized protein LOC111440990 [Cucurbita moschata]XP_022933620.1 uncharacterized protein LOC111440990 [Cucurbita moschata]
MESGRKIEAGESNTHPSKSLSSTLSSASNSSSDSSFELIVNEPGLYVGGTTSDSLKKKELHVAGHPDSDFAFINGNGSPLRDGVIEFPKPAKDKDIKAVVKNSRSGSEETTQYPQTQVMERVDNPNSPGYRIPSHVFSRTKSTTPTEWSGASNESLFSIQMGTMSFTREQLCWIGKSGELYRSGELAMSVSQVLNMKHSDCGLKGTHPDGDMAATEARCAQTMREVIRENSETNRMGSSTLTESSSQSASVSHQSESSTQSFQFPILSGDGAKSISFKGAEPEKEKANNETNNELQHSASSNPQIPKESSSDESPKADSNVAPPKRWLSCLSCCSFRS